MTDLSNKLAITRQTLYRHVAPDGTLRKDGLKVVEGGNIRYSKKKMTAPTGLTRFSAHLLLRPQLAEGLFLGL